MGIFLSTTQAIWIQTLRKSVVAKRFANKHLRQNDEPTSEY